MMHRTSRPLDEVYALLPAFSGFAGYDPLPALQAIDTPTLWLLGEDDRSIPPALPSPTSPRWPPSASHSTGAPAPASDTASRLTSGPISRPGRPGSGARYVSSGVEGRSSADVLRHRGTNWRTPRRQSMMPRTKARGLLHESCVCCRLSHRARCVRASARRRCRRAMVRDQEPALYGVVQRARRQHPDAGAGKSRGCDRGDGIVPTTFADASVGCGAASPTRP